MNVVTQLMKGSNTLNNKSLSQYVEHFVEAKSSKNKLLLLDKSPKTERPYQYGLLQKKASRILSTSTLQLDSE